MWKVYGFLLFIIILNAVYWIGEIKFEVIDDLDMQSVGKYSSDFMNMALEKFNTLTGKKVVPKGDCPEDLIVVAELAEGNTGNRIWEYAGAWGLAKLLGRQAYAKEQTLEIVGRLFPNLTLLPFESIMHCNLSFMRVKEDAEPLETLPERAKGNNVLYSKFHMLPGAILPFIDEARVEFEFNDKIMEGVRDTLKFVKAEGRTVVGVHVRRHDYIRLMKGRYKLSSAGREFYLDAMDWFRKNLTGENPLFVIVADDLTWTKDNLLSSEDVILVTQHPFHDLAFLCHANHTIVDYGTFGMWGALMSKGYTISLLKLDLVKTMSKYKNWIVFDEMKYLSRYQ